MATDAETEIVDLYVDQELKIARLYTLFADRYPDHVGFWTSLANEENRHAAAIRDLWNKARSGRVVFRPGRFRAGILRMFGAYLDEVLLAAAAKPAPFRSALGIARDLENALIEKKALGIFDGDAPEVRGLLLKLHDDSARHAAKLDEMWRREKDRA